MGLGKILLMLLSLSRHHALVCGSTSIVVNKVSRPLKRGPLEPADVNGLARRCLRAKAPILCECGHLMGMPRHRPRWEQRTLIALARSTVIAGCRLMRPIASICSRVRPAPFG